MFVLKSDRACTDTSLPILRRDTLLEGANNGVLWVFDIASRYSYAAQAAPANGAVVKNLDETGNDGTVVVQTGDAPSFSGGGIDLSGTTKVGNYINGPSAAAASIWGSANQYFVVCGYFRLPTSADWSTTTSLELLKFAPAGVDTYTTAAELVTVFMTTSKQISMRRQTSAGTAGVAISLAPNASDYGAVVQLAFWRDATGNFARLKSSNGTVLQSAAVGSNNTVNFAALTPKLGYPGGFGGQGLGVTLTAANQAGVKFRVYRGFVENLVTSGRDATTVLNDDYARVIARSAFS